MSDQIHAAQALQDDASLHQRVDLVGTEHFHRPEILDRIETLDDDFLAHISMSPWRD